MGMFVEGARRSSFRAVSRERGELGAKPRPPGLRTLHGTVVCPGRYSA